MVHGWQQLDVKYPCGTTIVCQATGTIRLTLAVRVRWILSDLIWREHFVHCPALCFPSFSTIPLGREMSYEQDRKHATEATTHTPVALHMPVISQAPIRMLCLQTSVKV